MSSQQLLIVGGGVSGLATAYYAGRQGINSILLEKTNRLGGLIQTDHLAGCDLEAGPDSYIAVKPAVTELAAELSELQSQIITSNDASRRIFIVRNEKLVPLPEGMTLMVPGKRGASLRSGFFSLNTKARFLSESFFRPVQRGEDISVGKLVQDHFGREVQDYVAEPLLAGVYGGDVQDLSARSVLPRFMAYEQQYGSLIKGVQTERTPGPRNGLFRSFKGGMQSLTDSLVGTISGSTRILYQEATAVRRAGPMWVVQAGDEVLSAPHLVLACPANVCAELLESTASDLAAELAAIPSSSAILTTLLFDASQIGHPLDGFGFLVPKVERRSVAAATWINTKFPSRVAPGSVALRAFIVAEQATKLLALDDSALSQIVAEEFRRLMGIEVVPRHSVVRRWPLSMPQYVVGHGARQERIKKSLVDYPGLHLVGNAYDGVGIPDCVRLAKEAAHAISD